MSFRFPRATSLFVSATLALGFVWTGGAAHAAPVTGISSPTSSMSTVLTDDPLAGFAYTDVDVDQHQEIPVVRQPGNWYDCGWSVPIDGKKSCATVTATYNESAPGTQTMLYRADGTKAPLAPYNLCTGGDQCTYSVQVKFPDQSATFSMVTLRKLPGYSGPYYVDDLNVDVDHIEILDSSTFTLSRRPYLMNDISAGSGNVYYRLNQPIAEGLGLYVYDGQGQLVAGPFQGMAALVFDSPWYRTGAYPAQTCAVLRNVSTGVSVAEACSAAGIYNSEGVHSLAEDYLSAGNDPSAGPVVCYAGDPVSCRTGYLVESKNDLTIPGRFPIALLRSYCSNQATEDHGLFGFGWTSPFNMAVVDHSATAGGQTLGYVTVRQENGSVIRFLPKPNGSWTPEYDLPDATLIKESNGSWTFVRKSLLTMRFTAAGDIDWIENNNNVRLELQRTTNQIQVSAEDGRTLTLALNAAGRVQSATGPAGRQVTYGYTNNDLTSVTYNYRTTASDSSDKALQYGYDSTHRLTTVTSPRTDQVSTVHTYYVGTTPRVDYQEDALGKVWDFAYNTTAEGLWQVTTTDPTGVVVRYEYEGGTADHVGNLARRIIAPGTSDASTWSYSYDDSGRITGSTDPEGRKSLAEYDSQGRLAKEVLPVAGVRTAWNSPGLVTYAYNGRDQITSITRKTIDANGAVVNNATTYTYDSYGNLTSTSTPQNANQTRTEEFHYEASRPGVVDYVVDPRQQTWDSTYDNRGLLTDVDAPGPGGITHYTPDAYGANTSLTLPEGTATLGVAHDFETSYTYYDNSSLLKSVTTPKGLTTTYEYDGNALISKMTDPGGNSWQYERRLDGRLSKAYDPDNHYTELQYDNAGRPTQQIDSTGVSTKTVYSSVTGLPASIITGRGTATGASQATITAATVTLSYNHTGQLLSSEQPDPNGGTIKSTYTYDPYSGDPLSTTTPAGLLTQYAYDPVGRLSSTTLPSEPGATRTEARQYDLAGRMTTLTDPRGNRTTWEYDPAGNITALVDRRQKATSFSYDDEGRLWKWVDPRGNEPGATAGDYTWTNIYDTNGWLQGVTDPYGKSTHLDYDQDGRFTSFTNRNLVTTQQWQYYTAGTSVGRTCLVKASDGGITGYTYDKEGRTTKIVRPDVDGTRNPTSTTCSTLDFTDAVQYGYDTAGRATSIDEPVLAAQTQTYWSDTGLPRKTTYPKGNSVDLTQDSLGRTKVVDYSASTAADLTYTYNRDNQPTTINTGTAGTTYNFTYSPNTGELATAALGSATYEYGYNKNGSVSSVDRPGPASADNFNYNQNNQVTKVNPGITGLPTLDFEFDAAGNRTAYRNDTNFWREDTEYDRSGNTSKVTDSAGTSLTNMGAVLTRTIKRDDEGVPTAIKVDRQGTAEWRNYAHDAESRTQGVCYGPSQAACTQATSSEWYTYDLAGNRKTARANNGSPTTYTYDDANRLLTVGPATLTYDNNGSLTTDQTGRTFTYDGAGRMLTSKPSGQQTADKYIYDALGNRTQIQLAGSTSNTEDFRYDNNHRLPVIDQVATSTTTTNYLHDGNAALAAKRGSDVEWFGVDNLGSVTDVYYDDPGTTTLKGVRARAFDYQPFGATRTATGGPATNAGFVPDFRYTGAVRDDSTQYQMRARELSVDTGRFNQLDPLIPMSGSVGSPYAYVDSKPTLYTDPTGMVGVPSDGGAAGTSWDFMEWAFGFNDASEAQNWTTYSTDTAICAATNAYDASSALLVAVPGIGPGLVLAQHTLLSTFEPRDWASQHGWLNPCSSGCATADNLNGAIAVGATVVGVGGAARGIATGAARIGTAAEGASQVAPDLANLSSKIEGGLVKRGWTPREIQDAYANGEQIPAVNKANGAAATRYVNPTTGKSVVIENDTGQVIHVGGSGFKYGPESGDLP